VLPRVVGGTDQQTTRVLIEVLGICCENFLPAPDHRHAALVKSVENAYRQMEIALANELSLAYPRLDIRAVLELAGTKWNVGTFRPSFGIGGYCIPLASHYVLEGAERPELLTLLRATIASSEAQARRVAEHVIGRGDLRRVGILGLSYTAGTKVWSHSPTIAIAATLRDRGVEVKVHDPYYAEEEIRRIVGAEAFSFPDGLGEFDAVLVATAHDEYRTLSAEMILESLTQCRLILDDAGLWAEIDFAPRGIEYHQAGDRDWLSPAQEKAGPG
jgi:nucleotide sugar dehydrogenase